MYCVDYTQGFGYNNNTTNGLQENGPPPPPLAHSPCPSYKWNCILTMVIICGYFAQENKSEKGEEMDLINHQIQIFFVHAQFKTPQTLNLIPYPLFHI